MSASDASFQTSKSRSGWSRWLKPARFCSNLVCAGIDLICPPACVVCGDAIEDLSFGEATPHRFCMPCLADLTTGADQRSCRRCGAPVGPYAEQSDCLECHRESFAFRGVHCLGVYEDGLREAVIRGKYLDGDPLLKSLSNLLWQYRGTDLRAAAIDVVVPVPQFWVQRIITRHHAPDVLAGALARRLQVPLGLPILAKRRWTKKQAHLERPERRENQHGVFKVNQPHKVAGKTVLLVDDVLTTGATAHSAARALLDARAKRVVVAVLARVLGDR